MELLRWIADLVFFAAYVGTGSSFPEPLSAEEERQWIERLQAGDDEAREILITHNLRLVAHIAKKYMKSGRDADDVISIGTIGLIKAVSTFDAAKGAPLSSYASRCVENEILMSLRAERKQVLTVSLTDAIGEDGDGNDVTLSDILGSDPELVFDAVQARLSAEKIARAVHKTLDRREETVVRLRFGLCGGYRMPQREVAELLGISRSYVSRIEKRALSKLFRELNPNAT